MMYASGQPIRTTCLDVYGLYEALMTWSQQQMMFMGFQLNGSALLRDIQDFFEP
jgi:hypothetical protein